MRITMHSVAVDGSSVPSAFLSHHQPPSSTCRRRHTLLLSSLRPVKKSSYQSVAVAGCSFAAAPPTKGVRDAISSVEAAIGWMHHESGGHTSVWWNDPTIRSRCLRLFTEAAPWPEVPKQNLERSVCTRNDFNTVVLISLLIWRTPPNVWRSRLIVYRFIYASVKPWDERHICL